MTMLGEQGLSALVEGQDLVEGRVHSGFQRRGAQKGSHSGQLVIVNVDHAIGVVGVYAFLASDAHPYWFVFTSTLVNPVAARRPGKPSGSTGL
jgi:hypothetical protein